MEKLRVLRGSTSEARFMSQVLDSKPSKYQRVRAKRAHQGMKLLRVWVPNPAAPGFREEAACQAAILPGAAEEREALAFIDATLGWENDG
jgi:hypothetical protein